MGAVTESANAEHAAAWAPQRRAEPLANGSPEHIVQMALPACFGPGGDMNKLINFAVLFVCVGASASASARNLTLEDRLAAQKAIEQVYWNHRVWPTENPGAKPPLSAVMPDSAIRAKVED